VVSLEGLYSKNMAMSQHFSNNLKVKPYQPLTAISCNCLLILLFLLLF
jgi:hypothetical protein